MTLPATWTPIGTRQPNGAWHDLPSAPVSVPEARALFDAGRLLMAQRREGERMVLVVKGRQL